MPDPDSRPWWPVGARLTTVLVAVAAALPYGVRLGERHFQSDDYWFVGRARFDEVLAALRGDWLTGAQGEGGWFRPLPRLLFYLDDVVWGPGLPAGYHLSNLLLHVLAAVLVAALVRAILLRGQGGHTADPTLGEVEAAALVAGVGFAWFPAATGAVSWISGRTDLLATVALLGALRVAARARLDWKGLGAFALLGGLALCAKESAFLLPVLSFVVAAFVAESLPAEERTQGRMAACLLGGVAAALVAAALGWRLHILGGIGGYGGQFAPDTGVDPFWWFFTWFGSASPYGLVAVVLVALIGRHRARLHARLAVVGLLVWTLACLPVVHLPLDLVENDRYAYLGAVGWAMVAGAMWPLLRRWPVLVVLLAAGLLFQMAMRDDAWIRAGKLCRRLEREFVRRAEGRGDLPVVIVAESMDFASYTRLSFQSVRGAKVIPWSQAAWLFRKATGGATASWGFQEEHFTRGARLLVVRSDWKVRSFDAIPLPETAVPLTAASDVALRIPYEGGSYYAAAWAKLRATESFLPAFFDGPQIVLPDTPTRVGRETMHRYSLGMTSQSRLWHFRPADVDPAVKALGGEAMLFRLESAPTTPDGVPAP